MRHHDDQHAAVGGGAQILHDVDLVARIERGGRLVRQHHRRFHRQHPRQRDAAALAAGQFGDAAFGEFHDVGRLHRPQHGLGILRRQPRRIGRAMRIAAERDDIPRRQRPVHDVALRQIGEALGALAQRQRRQRVAADLDVAVGRHQPRQRAQQRGLAGAVRPDQRDQMARRQRQRDVVQHGAAGQRHVRRRCAVRSAASLMRRLRRARGVRARSDRGRTARR